MTDLTIAVCCTTRTDSVERLLQSLEDKVSIEYKLLLVNNSDPFTDVEINRPRTFNLEERFPDCSYVNIEERVGISEHRYIAEHESDTRYLWTLDSDLVVNRGVAGDLYNHLNQYEEVDVVSCIWTDTNPSRARRFRPPGFNLLRSKKQTRDIIQKIYIPQDYISIGGVAMIQGVQGGSLMIDKKATKEVDWDTRYDYWWEHFDYFLQCIEENIGVGCDLDNSILHLDDEYDRKTKRHYDDRQRSQYVIEDKWNIVIEE